MTIARVDELLARRGAVCKALGGLGAQALVTDRPEHLRYLTGYGSPTLGGYTRPIIAVLMADGRLVMIVPGHEDKPVERDVPLVETRVYGVPEPAPADLELPDGHLQFMPAAIRSLRDVLQAAEVQTAAVDGLNAMYPPTTRWADALTDFSLVDASSLFWGLRRYKSAWEAERMSEAARYQEIALNVLAPQLRHGMTETEIDRLFRIEILRSGADDVAFVYAVVVEAGREIFGSPTDRPWNAGEILYLDGGASVAGYTSDFCRMFVAGSATLEQAASYQRVVDARDAALATFRPGLPAGELAEVMASSLGVDPSEAAGRYGHGLGAGLEPPSLNPDDPTPLDPGTVFCLEPAVTENGTYYSLEETYLVTEGGLHRLTPPAPTELVVVR